MLHTATDFDCYKIDRECEHLSRNFILITVVELSVLPLVLISISLNGYYHIIDVYTRLSCLYRVSSTHTVS